jgi:hypothetical protein
VRRLASATEPEIAGLPGIGPRVASAVLAALRPEPPAADSPAAEPPAGEPPAGEPPAGPLGNGAQNGTDSGERNGH